MNASEKKLHLAERTLKDPRWQRVLVRDPTADGEFFYSVKSTGVYCRPSCAARPARPENVQFHLTRDDAQNAGFRACKRCRPDLLSSNLDHSELVTAACRIIEAQDKVPKLGELAAKIGLSEFHFHRIFKSVTGLTPRQYAVAHQDKRIRCELEKHGTVTKAIFDAGYGSNSRFYEKSNAVLGMTPSRFRSGGADQDVRFAIAECSLGAVLVARSDKGICAILMGDDPDLLARDLQDRFPKANLLGGDADFESLVAQVIGVIEAPDQRHDLPLDIRGTAFQQLVWQELAEIPPGQTANYADIAIKIGAPGAVRAVAQACGANALAVAIPCHRVIRSDGSLSGYRWGVERKQALLKREGAR